MTEKLLYPDGRHLALYFPAGLPERGGSCSFASMKCLTNCLSYLVHNSVTKHTVDIFDTRTIEEIVGMMYEQLRQRKPKLLEWFCWGDCMPEKTEQVLQIMKELSKKGVIQCGFTRNIELWRGSHKIKNVHLGFTTEDESEIVYLAEEGLVAVPDYWTGETKIYLGAERGLVGGCGGNFYREKATQIDYEPECIECYKKKRGCFTQKSKRR